MTASERETIGANHKAWAEHVSKKCFVGGEACVASSTGLCSASAASYVDSAEMKARRGLAKATIMRVRGATDIAKDTTIVYSGETKLR